jgi:hypothetical protein
MPISRAVKKALLRMLWWVSSTPLGKPEVPEVYWMLITSLMSSSSTAGSGRRPDSWGPISVGSEAHHSRCHPPLGRPGGLDVQGIEAGVADQPNAGLAAFRRHPFQGLARHLQQGRAEESGNPVVPAGALQPGGQEILQGAAAGGITIDHRVMCRFGLTFGGAFCSILHGSRQGNILKGDIGQAALP